jgi:hypothetical protein
MTALEEIEFEAACHRIAALEADYKICKHSLENLKHDMIYKNAKNKELEAENAELRKNAERHRYMRFADLDSMCEKYWPNGEVPTGDAYDAVVDQAMKEAQS